MKLNLERFRNVLAFSDRLEAFKALPDRFAEVFERYDSSDCHPQYREDIYKLLTVPLELAEALIEPSHSAPAAISRATTLLAILGNIINHLENRPATKGYAILFPLTRSLHEGFFSTIEEANRKLEGLQALGLAADCEVVSVKITSEFSLRPEAPPLAIAQSLNELEREAAAHQLERKLNDTSGPTTAPAPFRPLDGNAGDREDL